MIRHMVTLGAVVLGLGVVSAMPAAAAGEHCDTGGYCLYSGANYTGTEVAVPYRYHCNTVASLGFPLAHSAARGYGDGSVLELYSDSSCQTSLGNVNTDVPDTAAASYQLIPIPG